MAVEEFDVGSTAVGLVIDGVPDTPWVSGALIHDPDRGIVLEIPYLERAALTHGEAEGRQFGHIDEWFSSENPAPPTNVVMRLQAGDVSLFNCGMSSVTSNWGQGSAFGRINAEHVVFASRSGPHESPLTVNRLQSRVDGLREWTHFTSVEEEVTTNPETGLIESVVMTVRAGQALSWRHGDASVSVCSDWNLTGPQELRTVHDDLVLLTEFPDPRPIGEHLAIHRQFANLLILLFGCPISFRQHKIAGKAFEVQYPEFVHQPYRELITRSTRRDRAEPRPKPEQLRYPLLWGPLLGNSGMERVAAGWEQWERVTLPLIGRLRRPAAMAEDVVVSASMALEAAGHLVGVVPGEETTYTKRRPRRPTTATYVFRVLADLGLVLPRAGVSMEGIARGVANNYNSIKHYDRGQFPDEVHTYLIGRLAMFVARLWVAKTLYGRLDADEGADPIASWTTADVELGDIEYAFQLNEVHIDRDGAFMHGRRSS